MTSAVLRVAAIGLNAVAAFYWFSYAMVWGPNDYIGGIVSTIPPMLAVIALVCSQPKRPAIF